MIRINLLKDAMDRKNVSMDDLANELKMCKQSLYYRLKGKIQFKITEMDKVKQYLELDIKTFADIFLDNK